MNNSEHYFDWAATSPADADILQESLELTLENWGNPSSTHAIGKQAKKLLDEARERCAKAFDVKPETIFFTSGGTESDQIPILSMLNKPSKGTILISSIEHPAVREQAIAMKKCGWNVNSIPADKNGIITPEAVEKLLTSDTMLVCVMAVNNETGSIQPIYEIADLLLEHYAGKRKPKFHVDCVQAAGKIPLNISHKGIDSAAFSSHKICGPRGIGILYLKDPLDSFLRGGGQEKGIRSGTENVFGAVAFSKCLKRYYLRTHILDDDIVYTSYSHYIKQTETTDSFLKNLSSLNCCTIIPPTRMENKELFSPYVVQAAFNKIPGNVMLRALDSKGFYISTGSACSSKKAGRPVLEAMHISPDLRENSVRFSFGPHTTQTAVNELFEAVKEIAETFNGK